jgi:hypothetical protein
MLQLVLLLLMLLLLLLLLSQRCVVLSQAQTLVFTALHPHYAAAYRINFTQCVRATLPRWLYLLGRLLSQVHHTSSI